MKNKKILLQQIAYSLEFLDKKTKEFILRFYFNEFFLS
jgi:hypothetical protein